MTINLALLVGCADKETIKEGVHEGIKAAQDEQDKRREKFIDAEMDYSQRLSNYMNSIPLRQEYADNGRRDPSEEERKIAHAIEMKRVRRMEEAEKNYDGDGFGFSPYQYLNEYEKTEEYQKDQEILRQIWGKLPFDD